MARVSICIRKWDQPSRIFSLFNQYRHQSPSVASVQTCEPSIKENVKKENANGKKWEEHGFGLIPTDYMYVMNCTKEDYTFSKGNLIRFGNMEMSASSGILNYGQGLLEGLKAYRREDEKIVFFRPELNALRMMNGAERMCMPTPTVHQFLEAVKQTVHANKHWVPPAGKGSLYIRPLLFGNGQGLGVGPASEYTFITYASPVGNYHKGALNLIVEEELHRAAPGGTGGIKAITNYASIFKSITEAKAKGYSDVVFLDAKTGKNLEEASTSNIFVVKGDVISTPATDGTILPGITRKSVIEIACIMGYQVEERAVEAEELVEADEVFLTGTAVVINSANSITYRGRRIEYKKRASEDSVAQNLYKMLTGIQSGRIEDKMGWIFELN